MQMSICRQMCSGIKDLIRRVGKDPRPSGKEPAGCEQRSLYSRVDGVGTKTKRRLEGARLDNLRKEEAEDDGGRWEGGVCGLVWSFGAMGVCAVAERLSVYNHQQSPHIRPAISLSPFSSVHISPFQSLFQSIHDGVLIVVIARNVCPSFKKSHRTFLAAGQIA